MQYLVAIAEEGQITRAARKLHVAQPALSHAIGQLECQLGVQLLERHAQGVTLTPAGAAFVAKARTALSAVADAEQAAHSLTHDACGVIEFGFLGVPPGLDSPGLLEGFSGEHPNIEMRFRELSFPWAPTSSWLAEVDMAACHAPPDDPDVWSQLFRHEPRVVLAPWRHRLAQRSHLELADVLGETFIGLDPSLEPSWAGFWSLDDHRGAPPERVTADRAANPQEVLAALAVRYAVTTVPASVAQVISNVSTGVVAVPLHGVEPSTIVLVGHEASRNPHAAALRAYVTSLLGAAGGL
jgi:DNA-binding transcriptional LysR family regulator